MIANYHTHTWRCNHSGGTERDYIETAIKRGVKVLGFSDHCPQLFPTDDYYSSMRMRPELAEEYVKTLSALREEYKKDIEILIGFEAEYYPKLFGRLIDFLKPLNIDYLILGQHFFDNEYDENITQDRTSPERLTRFYNQILEGVATGKFSYIAHPDSLQFEGDPALYEFEVRRFCEKVKAEGIPLEINFQGIYRGRSYPSERFFSIAADMGCDFVFGCDAHNPEEIVDSEVYKKALKFVDKLGITVLEKINLKPI